MQLLPHQIADAQFLATKQFAGCFSGMGSGKTLTALEGAKRVLKRHQRNQCNVVIAPPIALRMWAREIERHLGEIAVLVATGKSPLHSRGWNVMSYDIAMKRAAELSKLKPVVVIADEAHALKNVKAKRTKILLGSGGLASACHHFWVLTGTPVTRWNDDLYPFLCRADLPGLKTRCGGATVDRFNLRYTITQQRRFPGARWPVTMTVGSRNTTELNEWIYGGKLAVRRELADVWKAMPAITFGQLDVELELTPEARELLKSASTMSDSELAAKAAAQDPALATIVRTIGLAKVPAASTVIADRLEALEAEGTGVLVGCWHLEVIDALVKAIPGAVALDGRTPAKRKAEIEAGFNDGTIKCVIGQIAAMGVSLNLQKGGNNIIVVEENVSPAIMDQFYARLYRMGQERSVHVDTLYGGHKIEAAFSRIASNKRREHSKLNTQE